MLSNIPCSSLTLSTVIVTPKRFERLTYCLEGSCSIQLSYGVGTNKKTPIRCFFTIVGMARFELATSWSQTRRDDRTTLHPE